MPRKKQQNQKPKEESPYTLFSKWLFDGNLDTKLDVKIMKAVNKRAVICMFANHGNLTIFLNEYFNDFKIMSLPDEPFYKMIKTIVTVRNINRYSTTFFSFEKKNKLYTLIQKLDPFLKPYELELFLQKNENTNYYNSLMEMIGESKIKTQKVRSKKRK